jgi:hypothetical protein
MKQVTFLGTRDEGSAAHTFPSGFWRPMAKAMRNATRAPVVIRGVLVSYSRVPWRPLRADAGRQTPVAIFLAAVPVLFPNFGPPRCDRKTVDSIAIMPIAVDLAH